MGFPVDTDKCYLIEPFGTMQSFRTFPHSGDDWTYKKGVSSADTLAVFDGTVAHAGWDPKGAGNWLILAAADGGFWVYGHHASIYVKTGQVVKQGDRLGLIGATGFVTGPHLHIMRYTTLQRAQQRYIAGTFAKGAKLTTAVKNTWIANSGLTDPSQHYNTTTKSIAAEPEGFLMALNDYDQQLVRNAVVATNNRTHSMSEQVEQLAAELATIRAAVTKNVNGFPIMDVLASHAVATLKVVREQAATQGVALDEAKIAAALIDQGLPADIAAEIVKR